MTKYCCCATHHPLYQTWSAMKDRCRNPNHARFQHYGGRGVKVCLEWLNADGFWNFCEDMGSRPLGQTLDRIDNDGDYEPSNCRWASPRTQNRNRGNNRFIEFNGRRMTAPQWARELGIKESTIDSRIRLGWSPEKALTTPLRKYRRGQSSPKY